MEVGEGTDDPADADEEERREGGGHHDAVERRHIVVLDLQAQLSGVQKRIPEVVPGAEKQDLSGDCRTVLEHVKENSNLRTALRLNIRMKPREAVGS